MFPGRLRRNLIGSDSSQRFTLAYSVTAARHPVKVDSLGSNPSRSALDLTDCRVYCIIKYMNTKNIGDISEAFIAAELLKAGFSVSKPLGDNQRYDLVLYCNDKFYRVQCKTIELESNGSLSFPTCSSYVHRGGGKKDYFGEVELIMAYDHRTNKVYFEHVDSTTPKTQRTLVKSGRGIKAEDRELSKLVL